MREPAKFAGVSTRLDPPDLKRLDKIARRMRIRRGQVARLALLRGLELLEAGQAGAATKEGA